MHSVVGTVWYAQCGVHCVVGTVWWAQCACDGHSVVGSGDGRSRSGLSIHKRWSGLVRPHVAQFPGTEGCLKKAIILYA